MPMRCRLDDIPERVAIVDRKLKEWAPKSDWCELVSQHPEILQRIPDYYEVSELPSSRFRKAIFVEDDKT